MSEPRIIVWHDRKTTNKWLVAIEDSSGREVNEVPYEHESDAMSSAKMIERSTHLPVYRRSADGRLEVVNL